MKKFQGFKFPKIDLGTFLLFTGALANIPLWIQALSPADGTGPVNTWIREWLLPVTGSMAGLAMAVTLAVGLVYVLSRLGQLQPTIERKVRGKDEFKKIPNTRFYVALGSLVVLLITSLAILSPVEYRMISDNNPTLFTVLGGFSGAWAFGRVLAADLALAAITAVHGVKFGATGEAKPVTSTQGTVKLKKVAPKGTRKPVKDEELLAYLAEHPGASFQQVGDHFGVTRQAVAPRIKKLYKIEKKVESQ